MRIPAFAALFLAALPAFAQAPPGPGPGQQAWCGTFLIDDGRQAPRAASRTVWVLAQSLPRSCEAGDVLTMTVSGSNNPQVVAAAICDYAKAILIRDRPGGPTEVSCAYLGYARASRR
jgi:hypothetical protein